MWKVSCSPAPSLVLFMLSFPDMLDVEGVNWKQMLCTKYAHFDLAGMWVWLRLDGENGGEAGG